MATEQELPNCTIEPTMCFTVIGHINRIVPENKTEICIELDNAKIYEPDEKHVIKTFSDATLIEEISRRYDIDLIINQIK